MALARKQRLRRHRGLRPGARRGISTAGRSGTLGDIAAFSFCQDKIITTGGEGGLARHGRRCALEPGLELQGPRQSPRHGLRKPRSRPGFRWLDESFGSNYRMIEIEAALGLRQLAAAALVAGQRAANAAILMDAFRDLPGLRTPEPPGTFATPGIVSTRSSGPSDLKQGWNRDRIVEAINAAGVACFSGSCPEIYREKAFVDAGFQPAKRLPNGRHAWRDQPRVPGRPLPGRGFNAPGRRCRRDRHAKCHKGTGAGG